MGNNIRPGSGYVRGNKEKGREAFTKRLSLRAGTRHPAGEEGENVD